MGQGPAVLYLMLPPSHLEAEWQIESFRVAYTAIAQTSTFIRLDPRGYGLSDRDPDDFTESSALKILVKPQDVADVIAFLCSEQARVITGVHMPVDAGWTVATPYQAYAGGMPWDRTTTGTP